MPKPLVKLGRFKKRSADPEKFPAPDATAVRVALWRALHVQADSAPHVFEDEIGLEIASPAEGWKKRPDMDPGPRNRARASIVARARFVEDLVAEEAARGTAQYVILGAGLDTFVQRKPELSSRLKVFEIDKPRAQAWKRERLIELGYGVPERLRLVPVDFEAGEAWPKALEAAGFEAKRPTVAASTGVAMYLTRGAVLATLRSAASFAPGSVFVMSYMLPLGLVDASERTGRQMTEKFARAAGTPFLSFFSPDEMTSLAREAGFRDARTFSGSDLERRYFAGRTDGLRPSSSEEILAARTG